MELTRFSTLSIIDSSHFFLLRYASTFSYALTSCTRTASSGKTISFTVWQPWNASRSMTLIPFPKTIFFKLSQFLNAQCLIVSTESGIMISLALQSTNDKGSSTVTPSSIINFSSSFTIIFSFLSFWIYTYNMPKIRHKKTQRRRRCCKITTALKSSFRSSRLLPSDKRQSQHDFAELLTRGEL